MSVQTRMARRLTSATIILSAVYVVAFSHEACAEDVTVSSAVAAARRDIKQGQYSLALVELARASDSELSRSGEGLTLRGISRWGLALKKHHELSEVASRAVMLEIAMAAVQRGTERFSAETPAGQAFLTARTVVSGQASKLERETKRVPEEERVIDSLFERAINDFDRAGQLETLASIEWCSSIQGLGLLAKAHQFVICEERARQKRAVFNTARRTASPVASLADLERKQKQLEKDAIDAIAQLTWSKSGTTGDRRRAHFAADALLLVCLTSGRLVDWASRAHQQRMQRSTLPRTLRGGEGKPSPVATGSQSQGQLTLRQLIDLDPARAIRRLYSASLSNEAKPSENAGPLYACYLIDSVIDPNLAAKELKSLSRLMGKSCAWLTLERAQRDYCDGLPDEIVLSSIVTASGQGSMDRPILTSAPTPLMTSFFFGPFSTMLTDGPRFSGNFGCLMRLVTQGNRHAMDAQAKVRFSGIKLRFAILLAKSTLSWDKWHGYTEAGSAISEIYRLSEVLPESQRSSVAALEQRLQREARAEGFPPFNFCVTAGQPIWIEDPFTSSRVTISNPEVLVFSQGMYLISAPPESK